MTTKKISLVGIALGLMLFFNACTTDSTSTYKGTASVTKGLATTTTTNLFPSGQRVAGVGTITATNGTTWTVPAIVNYTNSAFPFAPDLYNPYGTQHATSAAALAAYNASNIVVVDTGGQVITAYIFADNYFELYVNGVAIGKDAVPFTDFNSHIVKFKVSKPYTIAMKLVDWEENLGLGSENNQGNAYHPGDGGLVAVFKDANGAIVATTGSDWKAQTFYTAPIQDLSCPQETGTTRSTANCSTSGVSNGSSYYALHWELPTNWMAKNYDDSTWPSASTYSNTTVGVSNKASYTNFTDIFDAASDDAEFIWSTNLILDNEVIVRYTVN